MSYTKTLLILIIFLISGCSIKAERYVGLKCEECNTNLEDLSDCTAYLEKEKSSPEVIKMADRMGVDLNNISKVVKKVTYPDVIVTCQFFN